MPMIALVIAGAKRTGANGMTDETKYGPWVIFNPGYRPPSEGRCHLQANDETREEAMANPFVWECRGVKWADVTAYRMVLEPVRETETHKVWASKITGYSPNFIDSPADAFTAGTVTTTTEDGKPVRIVWEATP